MTGGKDALSLETFSSGICKHRELQRGLVKNLGVVGSGFLSTLIIKRIAGERDMWDFSVQLKSDPSGRFAFCSSFLFPITTGYFRSLVLACLTDLEPTKAPLLTGYRHLSVQAGLSSHSQQRPRFLALVLVFPYSLQPFK